VPTRIQIDIVGPRPGDVDIEELSSILDDLRRAVTACLSQPANPRTNLASTLNLPSGTSVVSSGSGPISLPSATTILQSGAATLTKTEPPETDRVSLVGIVEGSDGLVMEVTPRAGAAVARITHALETGAFDDLPSRAHAALYSINQYTAKRNWGVRFRPANDLGIKFVEMVKADHVIPPTTRRSISGGTTLLARCLRVGGATEPRAELRLGDNRILYVAVSESAARELGKRLYDEVTLNGEAVWDATDGDLKEFKVTEIGAFHAVPVDVAFRELASASKGRWDDIDAEAFVNNVRARID
jgi:hypothetical protein